MVSDALRMASQERVERLRRSENAVKSIHKKEVKRDDDRLWKLKEEHRD